jgi:hypothetical protein
MRKMTASGIGRSEENVINEWNREGWMNDHEVKKQEDCTGCENGGGKVRWKKQTA